jgi:hypothetical protein
MSRHPKWEARLSEFVAKNRKRPYEPSRFDCLLMPAEAVKAVTGKDHGRGHRGKYKSTASAYRYLQSLGFKSPEEYLDSLFETKPVGFAQRGDLVLASDGIPAVCMGDFALSVGEGDAGLVRVLRSTWVKVWAI